MALTLPKSVRDAQRILVWAFPVLIGYGAVSLPSAEWIGRLVIVLGLIIVGTGWSSFGIIPEAVYNDVLVVADVALLILYWLFLFYARTAGTGMVGDCILLNISGSIFLLYAIWDFAALAGRDTAATATGMHLRRFALLCLGLAIAFFSLGGAAYMAPPESPASVPRALGGLVWVATLSSWHFGRLIAAVNDSNGS